MSVLTAECAKSAESIPVFFRISGLIRVIRAIRDPILAFGVRIDSNFVILGFFAVNNVERALTANGREDTRMKRFLYESPH